MDLTERMVRNHNETHDLSLLVDDCPDCEQEYNDRADDVAFEAWREDQIADGAW